jgi:hypothetical protein
MVSLPAEVCLLVQDALVAGTTFSEFVYNTRCFGENRADVLRAWVCAQVIGQWLVPFSGSREELEVLISNADGKRMVPCKGALTKTGQLCESSTCLCSAVCVTMGDRRG